MALTLLMVSFDSPEESPSTSPMLLSEVGSSEGSCQGSGRRYAGMTVASVWLAPSTCVEFSPLHRFR